MKGSYVIYIYVLLMTNKVIWTTEIPASSTSNLPISTQKPAKNNTVVHMHITIKAAKIALYIYIYIIHINNQ
jgi:hypothetical protein